MQVRIFESTDMASGLKLVKETLGPDALILSTRTIRGGKLGILGKPVLEITAAVDSPWPESNPQHQAPAQSLTQPQKKPVTQWVDDEIPTKHRTGPMSSTTYDAQFRLHQEVEEPTPAPQQRPESSQKLHTEMHYELDELKAMVKKLGLEMERLNKEEAPDERRQLRKIKTQGHKHPDKTPNIAYSWNDQADRTNELLSLLLAQGINETTAREIRFRTWEKLAPEEKRDIVKTHKALLHDIGNLLHIAPQFTSSNEGQRRIALVGPTGVGKTTTIAKIAARYLSNFSSSIALITIDTYRIAAVEQLKVYGSIMNLPVEIVISPGQFEQALQRHQDKELILIDTAGRSPKDTLCIEELATFFRADLAIDKHLVLSATTRNKELLEIIKHFDVLGINNTIITKTDECSTLGVILDIQAANQENNIPISWITNGQRVPEDLLTASRETLAGLILPPFYETPHNH